ncbi:cytochrome b5 [Fragilariopsis cylindrus CCMP1102]|uniref:Cytochrome b5 n=1 Tax=Fragilariopsis cylindrus CCMP1102 TaxID=635003 RepID=A0A1E7FSN6_9STRA|nr:cytochrome b5 [Fragilariopsis cylindrus CCMP1102]|eukprot:OEU21190.1 cytochrome b5 [Fragilariopsis cylindrus CCMP1102]
MAPLLIILGVPILSIFVTVGIRQKDAMNIYLMGFFRDLGRIKANKRRMKDNPNAMVAGVGSITMWDIILHRDDPLAGVDFSTSEELSLSDSDGDGDTTSSSSISSSLPTFSVKELEEFGNGRNGSPIYLSIFGRVYDVTAGGKFYGEDASYGMFAGKDVTRSLCLGRKESEYLIRSTEGLDEKQINEGKRWLSFFHVHDKYHHIGNLEKIDSEAWLDALIEDTLSTNNDDIVNDEDDDEYYDDDEDDDDDSEDINSQQSEEQ